MVIEIKVVAYIWQLFSLEHNWWQNSTDMNYKNQDLRVFVSIFKILRKSNLRDLLSIVGNINLINRTRQCIFLKTRKYLTYHAVETWTTWCWWILWVFVRQFLSSSSSAHCARHLYGWCVKCLPVAFRSVVPPCKARDCSFQWMCVLDSLKSDSPRLKRYFCYLRARDWNSDCNFMRTLLNH